MNELSLHPHVYSTGHSTGLLSMLENVWVRSQHPGNGTLYIISGFGNYNGGVRFYEVFRRHIKAGGKIIAIFSGSTAQQLTSKQVVEKLLKCGVKVYIINRKRLVHAKCYGSCNSEGEFLIVSSGNFTGPGMSQNVEVSLLLDQESTADLGFSWKDMIQKMLKQKWLIYTPSLSKKQAPVWRLLFDEVAGRVILDEPDEITMVLTLGHADTARINASSGSTAAKGTQYFWLSKDCYDFFPPLTTLNKRGYKTTYSCVITLHYIDINITDTDCRVTFEAENNFDFRLGTGKLRYTNIARRGDIAAISRTGDSEYELRILKRGSSNYNKLLPYAVNFIGHQGKQYGYIPNDEFENLLGISLPSV